MTSTTGEAASGSRLAKFQTLLRVLFQFDEADLDFGIYRIMNHKRATILRFINESLPDAVDKALNSEYISEQASTAAALEGAILQVKENLGDDAIDNNRNLAPHLHSTPVGKHYLACKKTVEETGARSRVDTEARIYNYLHTFFSRYYQDGDFVSKRRYSRNQRYIIPYNGEEIYFHWANSDQYYVKTDEYFHNYDWKTPNGITVRFQMNNADVEHNNAKGDRRFFIPVVTKMEYMSDGHTITLPFDYRPLTSAEQTRCGNRKQQEKIIAKAIEDVLHKMNKLPDVIVDLTGQHRQNSKGDSISHLEHHLKKYTSRNKADFFVHKDLNSFLNRELDYYLKNEVLNLNNLVTAGLELARADFQVIRLIKTIGAQIIDFLSQIEDFQKMLWEKRKFVTATNYCIALRCIDKSFYSAILSNDQQWEEWRVLFGIDSKSRVEEYLRTHPTLMLDTRYFDETFTDQLLTSFEDIETAIDGLIIHGDNWQALQLLEKKYSNRVGCIYIDPPYNTGQDGFLYKDHYQHSTWLTMIDGLIPLWKHLLSDTGSFVSHIDEHEINRLDELIRMRFGVEQNVGPIIWDKRNPKGDATAIATQHEYLCWAVKDYDSLKRKGGLSRNKENAQTIIDKAKDLIRQNGGSVSGKVRDRFKSWMEKQDFSGGEKAYVHLDDDGLVYQSVSMAWPNKQKAPEQYFEPLIHPNTGRACPVPKRGWRNPPKTMASLLEQDEILFGTDETTQPRRKYLLQDFMSENVPSIYYFGGSDDNAQNDLKYFFPNPKPVRIGEYIIAIAAPDSQAIVLDCFAGSGTTGHAVINLNRSDGGQRKFILVEIGEYFYTEILPRIKRISYAPEWKDGEPCRPATQEEIDRSPRIIKYLGLESYEDSLDSIEFDTTDEQQKLDERLGNEYLVKYMLNWETKASAALMNTNKMSCPFSYHLQVHINGDKHKCKVDLPETFNWLLGLKVHMREVYHDKDRRYLVYRGETSDHSGHRVVVIWRETDGWNQDDYARDRQFIRDNRIAIGTDTVYTNGGSCIPGAKSIEPIFKARMFAQND